MISLGPLAVLAPWALAAVPLLAVLWWLLRVTPPSPRLVRFPPVRLLFGLESREDTAARTPWWVMLLRLVLALLVILAVAHPVLHPRPAARVGGPLLLVVDDGWASARDWEQRRAYLDDVLAGAERDGRPVRLLSTAPPADGSPVTVGDLTTAAGARAQVQALAPKPWSPDRAAAMQAVEALPRERVTGVVWLADGLDWGHAGDLAEALRHLGGGLEVVAGHTGRVLLPPPGDEPGNRLTATVLRPGPSSDPERVAVRALDSLGRVLGREEGILPPGQTMARLAMDLPGELRNRLVRLDVEGERGAASVVLLDDRWRRRPVGLAGGEGGAGSPLLADLYYVEKALAPSAELHRGELSELLSQTLAVLVVADMPAPQGAAADALSAWVAKGGVLVRFAGPALAHSASQGNAADPLLPVRLRAGGRSLGGAMSWTTAQGLAAFPETGPFAGLDIPTDVTVRSQVLAEPSLDLGEHTWARLADGTPLVTAARQGRGWVVLVHTTANADWSNLALSGLFPEMLKRLVALADGVPAGAAAGPLEPVEVLDGFGRLIEPTPAAAAIPGLDRLVPGPRHPPGLYGRAGARVAVNLGPRVGTPKPFEPPAGVSLRRLGERPGESDLRPGLLAAALALLVLDMVVALALRGVLRRAGAAALLLGALVGQAHAGDFALDAALETRLAYVKTGDQEVDRKSLLGLSALSRVLVERSTARMAEPMGIDPEADPVLFFPLLYWPVPEAPKPLSAKAVEKLNDYLRRGGLIVFDTGAAGGNPASEDRRLATLTQGLAIPPLAPLDGDHVLMRSFYLLKDMPGRTDDGAVWVEDGQGGDNDGVSPVVVGGKDWAGAWAAEADGRPLFAVVPGGERQREMAYRFGVNLVMYALTGNYKSDQVHLPAILQRLGR